MRVMGKKCFVISISRDRDLDFQSNFGSGRELNRDPDPEFFRTSPFSSLQALKLHNIQHFVD